MKKDKNFIEFVDKVEEYNYFFDEPRNIKDMLENSDFITTLGFRYSSNKNIDGKVRNMICDITLTMNSILLAGESMEVSLNRALIPVVVNDLLENGYRQVGNDPIFTKDK